MSLSKQEELVAPQLRSGLSLGRFGAMREAGLIVIILALCVAMSFASPHFATWGNLRAMLMSFSIEGIVVVGMTVLLIVGGIDLAVGSVVCFAMVVGGSMFLLGLDPYHKTLQINLPSQTSKDCSVLCNRITVIVSIAVASHHSKQRRKGHDQSTCK